MLSRPMSSAIESLQKQLAKMAKDPFIQAHPEISLKMANFIKFRTPDHLIKEWFVRNKDIADFFRLSASSIMQDIEKIPDEKKETIQPESTLSFFSASTQETKSFPSKKILSLDEQEAEDQRINWSTEDEFQDSKEIDSLPSETKASDHSQAHEDVLHAAQKNPADVLSTITKEQLKTAKEKITKHPITNSSFFHGLFFKAVEENDLALMCILHEAGVIYPQPNKVFDSLLIETAAQKGLYDPLFLLKQLNYTIDKDIFLKLVSALMLKKGDSSVHVALIHKMRTNLSNPFEFQWFERAYDGQPLESFQYMTEIDLTHKNIYGMTALHYACIGGNINCVKTICELFNKHKIPIDVETLVDRFTPITFAVSHNHFDVVRYLTQIQKCNLKQVNLTSSPIGYSNSLEMVKLLLIQGTTFTGLGPNSQNNFLNGRLSYPNTFPIEFPAIIRHLSKELSDSDRIEFVNHQNRAGSRPFLCLFDSNFKNEKEMKNELADTLLSCGADINAGNLEGETALHIAAKQFALDDIAFLIDRGADLNKHDHRGNPPLFFILSELEKEREKKDDSSQDKIQQLLAIRKILVKAGADLNFHLDKTEQLTPLHVAVKNGAIEEVVFLLQNRADVNREDENGKTPLFYAQSEKILEILMKHGANINARDNEERTVLNSIKKLDMVQFFIDAGADINARSDEGLNLLEKVLNSQKIKLSTKFILIAQTVIDRSLLMHYIKNPVDHINIVPALLCESLHTGNLTPITQSKNPVDVQLVKDYLNLFASMPGNSFTKLVVEGIIFAAKGDFNKAEERLAPVLDHMLKNPKSGYHVLIGKIFLHMAQTSALLKAAPLEKEMKTSSPTAPDYEAFSKFSRVTLQAIKIEPVTRSITYLLELANQIDKLLATDILTPKQYILYEACGKKESVSTQIQKLEKEQLSLMLKREIPESNIRGLEITQQLIILKPLENISEKDKSKIHKDLQQLRQDDMAPKIHYLKPLQYEILQVIPVAYETTPKNHLAIAHLFLEHDEPSDAKDPMTIAQRYSFALMHVNKALEKGKSSTDVEFIKSAKSLKTLLERGLGSEADFLAGTTHSMFSPVSDKSKETKETKKVMAPIKRLGTKP